MHSLCHTGLEAKLHPKHLQNLLALNTQQRLEYLMHIAIERHAIWVACRQNDPIITQRDNMAWLSLWPHRELAILWHAAQDPVAGASNGDICMSVTETLEHWLPESCITHLLISPVHDQPDLLIPTADFLALCAQYRADRYGTVHDAE